MSLLPTTGPNSPSPGGLGFAPYPYSSSTTLSIRRYFRRLFRFPQMSKDFEYALWQMLYLCIAPRRVYRNIYYHKQTKNQWARDDPAFVIVLSFLLCWTALGWGLVYGHGAIGIIKQMLYMVFVDFIIVGLVVSTLCWFFANHFLTTRISYTTESRVEWAYSFDVHCNAFFPLFCILYVVQFFLQPVLIRDNWVCLFIGNTLFLIAVVEYAYVTFLGYNALPFLVHTELLLYPVLLVVALWMVSLFGFNVSKHVLTLYFGKTATRT